MERMKWQDGVTLLAGLILVAALFVIDFTLPEGLDLQTITWNFVLVGFAAVVVAGAALYAPQAWEEWVAVALGVWMIASPWVLGFSTVTVLMWLAVICGAIITVMAVFVLLQPDRKRRF